MAHKLKPPKIGDKLMVISGNYPEIGTFLYWVGEYNNGHQYHDAVAKSREEALNKEPSYSLARDTLRIVAS